MPKARSFLSDWTDRSWQKPCSRESCLFDTVRIVERVAITPKLAPQYLTDCSSLATPALHKATEIKRFQPLLSPAALR
jgi:hypothetical protein